ncbi:MAG: Gfo/Idh/MocA family oxidoreductase [Candidatus Poribacteria bacterium]|nr:Gfo/Idh/MocA family oxidoreductase [Candidatus Poribacteria bacterium]
MSKPSKRAAIIGLGGQGQAHYAAYNGVEDVKVAAVCEISTERLVAFIDENPDVRGYTNADELLENEQCDILSIVTNTPSHADLTVAAVEAGVSAVLCEKPMAHSLTSARQMIDICTAKDVRLAINHMRRWSPRYHQLRDMLKNGQIGEIGSLVYASGGALFACIATHIFDLMRMLTGREILCVSGRFDTFRRPNPRGAQFHDPGGHALVQFEGDSRAFLDLSENLGVPSWFDIHGSLGRVHIEEERRIWQVFARQAHDREQPPWAARNTNQPVELAETHENWTTVLSAGITELLGDGPVNSSGEDGYAALEAIVAAHISHENGGVPVALPLTGDDLLREFTFT